MHVHIDWTRTSCVFIKVCLLWRLTVTSMEVKLPQLLILTAGLNWRDVALYAIEPAAADKYTRNYRAISMLPFCGLSVCLSVCYVRALCSNGKRYRRDFFCIRQPRVSHKLYLIKIGLHRSTTPPQILSKSDPPPVNLSVGDIRWQIAAEWLKR